MLLGWDVLLILKHRLVYEIVIEILINLKDFQDFQKLL